MEERRGQNEHPSVLIIGGDTRYNRGDCAIRAAFVDQLRAWDPSVRIGIVSRTPERDRREWGVETLAPTVTQLLKNRELLNHLQFVFWGGGHLLQDDSSKVKNVYWAAVLTALRRRTRCPLIGYGLGVGPVTTAWGRFFATCAVSQLTHFAARDEDSARLVRQWSKGRLPVSVVPDPAIGLEPAAPTEARAALEKNRGVPFKEEEVRIGIGLRRWFHLGRRILPLQWRYQLTGKRPRPTARYERLLDNLAGALNRFSAHRNTRVLFFPMYCAPWEGDDVESRELGRRLTAPSHVLNLDVPAPIIKGMAGLCDLFIGVRLHSAILALGMNVPTLGVAYVRKGNDLFERLGLSEQVLNISDIAGADGEERLLEKLTGIHEHRDAVRAAQSKVWAPLESECRSGYAEMIKQVMPGRERDDSIHVGSSSATQDGSTGRVALPLHR